MDLWKREDTENWEEKNLYPHSLRSKSREHTKRVHNRCPHEKNAKGSCDFCDPCKYRTDFQRDRDRILHSRAFRRLMHKTQVFIQPPNEEFRTRLSHTMEVVQISKAIARALKLNEIATEAIALGHDLGHTPFGHAGEKALRTKMLEFLRSSGKDSNTFLQRANGFEHNEQSIRVVDLIEDHYWPKEKDTREYIKDGGFFGLNLTYKVREGIYTHTRFDKKDYDFDRKGRYCDLFTQDNRSLEAQIVDISDSIAYTSHDFEDAINFGILTIEDIPEGDMRDLFEKPHKDRLRLLIEDVITESKKELDQIEAEVKPNLSGRIKHSSKYQDIIEIRFKELSVDKIYKHPYLKQKEVKAQEYVELLFDVFLEYYEQSPGQRRPQYLKHDTHISNEDEGVVLAACDEISGLTDNQAIYYFEALNSPSSFKGWMGWFGNFVPSH